MVFTSGGTEADNLALKGLFWSRRDADPRRVRVLASAVEHHAVLDPLHWLGEHEGAEVELLPVDRLGRLDLGAARAPPSSATRTRRAGLGDVGQQRGRHRRSRSPRSSRSAHRYDVPVHSDAVQASGQVPVDFAACGLDAMTVTGHKIGGPLGVGALVLGREADA